MDVQLWNAIRDFIVQNITGGITSDGSAYNTFGGLLHYYDESWDYDSSYLSDVYYQINNAPNGLPYYLSASDWLATTLTIISLIFILVACVMFVVKMVKLVGNLVK